jgi:hypothetical protein
MFDKKGVSVGNVFFVFLLIIIGFSFFFLFFVDEEGINFSLNSDFIFSSVLKIWTVSLTFDFILIKYVFLIFLVLLLYSIFSSFNFPKSEIVKVFLSVFCAFLFLSSFGPSFFLALRSNYLAIPFSLLVIFPALILGVFSFFVVRFNNLFFGILQRFFWGIYFGYLALASGLKLFFDFSGLFGEVKVFSLLWKYYENLFAGFEGISSGMGNIGLFVLFLSSLILFWIGFVKNRFVLSYFENIIDSSQDLKSEDNFSRFARMQNQVAKTTRS